MNEPPIRYYLQGVDSAQAWQYSDTWPLKDQDLVRYYFGPGDADGKVSINSGLLQIEPPAGSQAMDTYTVDYTTTSGNKPRWTGLATPHEYPNMRANDVKALTYTTPAFDAPLNVIGHPVAHVWLSSDAPDLDIVAYLEVVDSKGNSTYITQGNLRASHRALSQAPFDNFGLPWHNHFESELQPLPANEPVELVFDLLPTAYHFSPGSYMRITIAFADAGNFETPILNPAPVVYLLRDAVHASYVEIPIRH